MGTIGTQFARVSNLLSSQAALAQLTRTNLGLFRTQTQLASGRAIGRYSDDAVKAATISVLDDQIERAGQRSRNLQHATSSLNVLDAALAEASELILQAKSIASSQVNVGSTPQEREQQAGVVTSLIENLFNIINRESVAGAVFGGETPGHRPMHELLGGYRYTGRGEGLITDLGLEAAARITIGARGTIGGTSARIESDVDLDPALTATTRLSEVSGARGLGVTLGNIEFSFNGGPRLTVDLTGADTAGDIARAIEAAVRDYEQSAGMQVLGPGGVAFQGGAFTMDVVPDSVGNPLPLNFFDIGTGVTARDLGLTDGNGMAFSDAAPGGMDIHPRITWRTSITDLAALTDVLGAIRINSMGQTRVVDLSAAQTVGDLRNLIEGTGLGLRVEINEDGTAFNIVNEVAGGQSQAMSIEEISGANLTATRLGIRSLSTGTRIGDFNDGRGVQLVHGSIDPVTGLPDPARDVDFTITLGDPAATTFDVDLRPQDMATVQTLLDRINAQAAAAGVSVPADFVATLGDGPNGIVLLQNTGFANALQVQDQNNSPAAGQLGLLTGAYDPATSTFRAEDNAKVRVDNLFTNLIDLRDALLGDDTAGITLAGGTLENFVDRLAEARALVGGYAARVDAATRRQEDQNVLDERMRSELRDLDYSEAAVRLSLLQTQLQAGMQTTALLQSRSLLDFLG